MFLRGSTWTAGLPRRVVVWLWIASRIGRRKFPRSTALAFLLDFLWHDSCIHATQIRIQRFLWLEQFSSKHRLPRPWRRIRTSSKFPTCSTLLWNFLPVLLRPRIRLVDVGCLPPQMFSVTRFKKSLMSSFSNFPNLISSFMINWRRLIITLSCQSKMPIYLWRTVLWSIWPKTQ